MAHWLESYQLMQAFLGWLERIGMGSLRTVFAPLFVLILATPVIVVACLLLVAVFMTPAMVTMVGRRRFAGLELKQGGSLVVSVLWSLASTSLAVVALVLSNAVLEKFGGDSVGETARNVAAYRDHLRIR